eukprot:1721292-Rhodomonas_salina.3
MTAAPAPASGSESLSGSCRWPGTGTGRDTHQWGHPGPAARAAASGGARLTRIRSLTPGPLPASEPGAKLRT